MRKRILPLILTLIMALSLLSTVALADNGVSWKLEDGTLTISGVGAMEDYKATKETNPWGGSKVTGTNVPWWNDRGSIQHIVIEDGVTSIGDYAFYWLWADTSNVVDISIPASVKSVGDYAFNNCLRGAAAENATISLRGVESIGKQAFYNCTGLTSIIVPDTMTDLGDSTFYACSGLKSVTIGTGVTELKKWVFRDCTALETVTFKAGSAVRSIKGSVFEKCNAIKSISIPASVTTIETNAFAGWTAEQTIVLPYTEVEAKANLVLGQDRTGWCGNAIVQYQPAPNADWCKNISLTVQGTVGETAKSYQTKIDWEKRTCTLVETVEAASFQKDASFDVTAVSGTVAGVENTTVEMPERIHFEPSKSERNFMAVKSGTGAKRTTDYITLQPQAGSEKKPVQLSLCYMPYGYVTSYSRSYVQLFQENTVVDKLEDVALSSKDAIPAMGVPSLSGTYRLDIGLLPGATVTVNGIAGTKSAEIDNADGNTGASDAFAPMATYTVNGLSFANTDKMVVVVKNGLGVEKTYTIPVVQYLDVSVQQSDDGSIILADSGKEQSTKALAGGTVKLIADPALNRKVAKWIVTDASSQPVAVTPGANANLASFVMPNSSVTVRAQFEALGEDETPVDYRISAVEVTNLNFSQYKDAYTVDIDQVNSTITITFPKAISNPGNLLTSFKYTYNKLGTPTTVTRWNAALAKPLELTYSFTDPESGTTFRHTYTVVAKVGFDTEEGNTATPGSEENPYLIQTADDLLLLSEMVSQGADYTGCYFKQTSDLDFAGKTWKPIGTYSYYHYSWKVKTSFTGVYDGAGHSIKNMTYDVTTDTAEGRGVGVFGTLGSQAVVKNLVIDSSCSFKGFMFVGAVAGDASMYRNTTISDCINYAAVHSASAGGSNIITEAYVGGIAGRVYGTITNCENHGDVTTVAGATSFANSGAYYVGGIVGECYGTILHCRNTGAVFGGNLVGGIAGRGSTVVGCSNTGTVRSDFVNSTPNDPFYQVCGSTGGILGETLTGAVAEGCYNSGAISSNWPGVGGIVGHSDSEALIANCYNVGTVSTTNRTEGLPDAAGTLVGYWSNQLTASALYALEQDMPAFGDIGKTCPLSAQTMSAADMKAASFVDTLNGYITKKLDYAVWASDEAAANDGYPVIHEIGRKKNYECSILTAKFGDLNATVGENTITLYVPYETDLSAATLEVTASPDATVFTSSASISGNVKTIRYIVLAEDGESSRRYTAKIIKAAAAEGLAALKVTVEKTDILSDSDFAQDKYGYEISLLDAELVHWSQWFNIQAIPATSGAGVTASFNGSDAVDVTTVSDLAAGAWRLNYKDKLKNGENTLVLKSGETTYTITIHVTPTLKSVSFDGCVFSPAFSSGTKEYTMDVFAGTKQLTVNAEPYINGVEITPNGSIDVSQKPESITLTVGTTTYTFHLNWLARYNAKFSVTNEGGFVRVYDPDGALVTPEKGAYVLNDSYAYSYVAMAKGCVTETGIVTGLTDFTDGVKTITLKTAPTPDYTLPSYTGDWPVFRGNDQNMGVTSAKTPVGDEAMLQWAVKSGEGWSGSPMPPIVLNGDLYTGVGKKIIRLDRENGGTLAVSADLPGSFGFALNPITYGDGMLFVPVNDGRIVALNAATLEQLWVTETYASQQTLSPITYHDGYIYSGTWRSETSDGYYMAFDVTDEDPTSSSEVKYPTWKLTHTGGFYWAGAYATDSYVIFGSDDGQIEGKNVDSAVLYSVSPVTGQVIDTIEGIKGDIRSTISATDDGYVYFTTKSGIFAKVKVKADGTFDDSTYQTMNLGRNFEGMCTGTPIVYNGVAFIGVGDKSNQFGDGAHYYAVIDVEHWAVLDEVKTPGYVQTSALLSNAYEESGKLYVYLTYNRKPGGIYVITYDKSTKKASGADLFIPGDGMAEFCICSLICDNDGTLYFKNDSGYLFAVSSKNRNQNAADAVTALLNTLPAAEDITLEDKAEIIAARAAFDKLTESSASPRFRGDGTRQAEAASGRLPSLSWKRQKPTRLRLRRWKRPSTPCLRLQTSRWRTRKPSQQRELRSTR